MRAILHENPLGASLNDSPAKKCKPMKTSHRYRKKPKKATKQEDYLYTPSLLKQITNDNISSGEGEEFEDDDTEEEESSENDDLPLENVLEKKKKKKTSKKRRTSSKQDLLSFADSLQI